jgi:hypothetical protein
MLRIDDRPHFVPSDSGYRVAKPVWYQLYPPDRVYRSRVMFVVRSLAERTGLRNPWVRMAYLRDVARERRQSFVTVFRYMSDLRRSASSDVGYSAAFSAQMLNQQLFFHHFPGSREESINRLRYLLQRYLLQMVRRDHPDLSLFVSPIPSYQLVGQQPVDSAFLNVIGRLPISYQAGVEQEAALYETVRELARQTGWGFIDPLPALRGYQGVCAPVQRLRLPPASSGKRPDWPRPGGGDLAIRHLAHGAPRSIVVLCRGRGRGAEIAFCKLS